MRGRKPQKVIIQVEQLKILQTHLKKATTEYRVVRRARILVLAQEGKYPGEIAEYVGCGRATVWRICNQFQDRGLEVLQDLPRSGAPRRISPPPESSDSSSGLYSSRPEGPGADALVHA